MARVNAARSAKHLSWSASAFSICFSSCLRRCSNWVRLRLYSGTAFSICASSESSSGGSSTIANIRADPTMDLDAAQRRLASSSEASSRTAMSFSIW